MWWYSALLVALSLAGASTGAVADSGVKGAAREAMEGRWDLTIRMPEGPRPSWLEIRHSGRSTLVGQFVAVVGSARPISRIEVDGSEFRFSIPPQWEQGAGDLSVEGRLQGDRMSGTITFPDGRRFDWSAVRAPSLRRSAEPSWGQPVRIFNGTDLAGWRVLGENRWTVEDGVLRNTASGGNLATEQAFTDFKLHLEFRYPAGGNSGVYLRGRYEVQIIDGPADELADNLGAVYGFLPPSVLAAAGPGEWQSFDITLVGRLVTVVVNGRTVVHEREIPGITGGALDSDEGAPGPILLQGDHGPIEFRNIVLTPAL